MAILDIQLISSFHPFLFVHFIYCSVTCVKTLIYRHRTKRTRFIEQTVYEEDELLDFEMSTLQQQKRFRTQSKRKL